MNTATISSVARVQTVAPATDASLRRPAPTTTPTPAGKAAGAGAAAVKSTVVASAQTGQAVQTAKATTPTLDPIPKMAPMAEVVATMARAMAEQNWMMYRFVANAQKMEAKRAMVGATLDVKA